MFEIAGKSISFLILSIGSVVLRGLVIAQFWAWFIVSIFKDLPIINIGQALGISMVISVLTVGVTTSDEKHSIWAKLIGVIFGYLIVLFMGWILKLIIYG